MVGQAIDLELVDLEVSDHRSPDRKPANDQDADGTLAGSKASSRCLPLMSSTELVVKERPARMLIRTAVAVRVVGTMGHRGRTGS
jgi:hypothetical protein